MLTFNFLTIFPPFECSEINSKKYPLHFPALWQFSASTAAIRALSEQQPAGTAPLGCQVAEFPRVTISMQVWVWPGRGRVLLVTQPPRAPRCSLPSCLLVEGEHTTFGQTPASQTSTKHCALPSAVLLLMLQPRVSTVLRAIQHQGDLLPRSSLMVKLL